MKTYIFSRKTGTNGTKIMETDKKTALKIMKENRKIKYQLGMLTGDNFDTVIKVYGEYAPFHIVNSAQELVTNYENKNIKVKSLRTLKHKSDSVRMVHNE